MSVSALARRSYKSLYTCYQNASFKRFYRADLNKHIQTNTDGVLPKLTHEEQEDISVFWKKYGITLSSFDWHRYYYGKSGIKDPRFVPDDVFHRLIRPKMNDINAAAAWSDKAYTDWVVRDVNTVHSVVRCVNGRLLDNKYNLIDANQANRIMNQYESLVFKPTMYTDTGRNVTLLNAPFKVDEILKQYGKFFVVQLPLKQHSDLAKLNESSVNTIRIDTVLFDQKAHATSAFIKVGQPGQFADNGGGNKRIFIGIRDGKFTDFAFDHDCNKFYSIPSRFEFAGKKVPFFQEMCAAVEKAHSYVPHFGLAFWDVSVDQNGEPTIVEMNLRYPDSYVPQVGSGPFFGDYTEEVLDYLCKTDGGGNR